MAGRDRTDARKFSRTLRFQSGNSWNVAQCARPDRPPRQPRRRGTSGSCLSSSTRSNGVTACIVDVVQLHLTLLDPETRIGLRKTGA